MDFRMCPTKIYLICYIHSLIISHFVLIFCSSSGHGLVIPTRQQVFPSFGTSNFANIIANLFSWSRVSNRYQTDIKATPQTRADVTLATTPSTVRVEINSPSMLTSKVTKNSANQFDDDTQIKILDGYDAPKGEFPFIASLKNVRGRHNCGGSILDSFHILTAAHCFTDDNGNDFDLDPEEYSVTVGEHHGKLKDKYEQNLAVEHICMHSKFKSIHFGNDIAIIKLKERIQFFPGVVERARLPPRDGEVVDVRRGTADVIGWGTNGTVNANGKRIFPDILQTTYVHLYKATECRSFQGIRASLICAGDDNFVDGGRARDACRGDSGGPLICSGVVCGIVSYGPICIFDKDSRRAGYTRIHYFREWIRNYVAEGEEDLCRRRI